MTTPDERLVDELVRDLAPVRRLRPLPVRLGLWTGIAIATALAPGLLSARPDLAASLRSPMFLCELGVSGLGALFLAGLALEAARPEGRPRAAAVATAAALLGLVVALALMHPTHRPEVTLGELGRQGIPCLGMTLALGVGPLVAGFLAVRRGATTVPGIAGALLGSAALLAAYAAMRIHCPNDAALHLLLGHALPIALTAAAAGVTGVSLLGRWSAPRAEVRR